MEISGNTQHLNKGISSLWSGGATVAVNLSEDKRSLKRQGKWKSDTADYGHIIDSLGKKTDGIYIVEFVTFVFFSAVFTPFFASRS